MAQRGRKPLELRTRDKDVKLIKRNYYIDERYAKALSVISALTGKELSLLVNEAIGGLIKKYQPQTDIDLMKLKTIDNEK
ncbi:MAG TPA: ribbon-helix-helix domain-containing protein [Deltaproteobacteria bacterium]|nr:ribbon-helix-helix domain-containing protein [Deltaproteobacteria bacterium]HPP81687.1 ribbon-helix-helix domain-containing protein [Deltaproteobacteria bacterium]